MIWWVTGDLSTTYRITINSIAQISAFCFWVLQIWFSLLRWVDLELMGDSYINEEISEIPSNSLVDDIFAHLPTLTADASREFIRIIEDLMPGDICRCVEDPRSSGRSTSISDLENCLLPSDSYIDNSSCDACETGVLGPEQEIVVNSSSETVQTSYRLPFFFQVLMLPLFAIRLACKLGLACYRCTFSYVRCAQLQIRSITSRVRRTLRGSSDDIGWLQNAPGMPPVEDGTPRFLELLDKIRNGEHSLPDSYVYLLIPGLFSNHGPLYFVETKKFFSKMGLVCHIAKIHSEVSVEHNAWELKQYIEELYWGCGKRVMLLGHSKGGVDAAAALSLYWPDLKNKVAGLALVQSPYGGTPVASDILREGQIADKETRRVMELIICKLIKGDMRALEDLTYEKRKQFIMNHKLPEDIPMVSFRSEASIAPGVLASMTHIAHAELPRLPLPAFGGDDYSESPTHAGRQVPVVVPVSAAMAACAMHLKLRYGEKSDGLVTCRDAEVPGSVVIRPERKLDHAWMVYSSRRNSDDDEPDACEMCEAILTLLVEIGKKKEEERAGTSS